MMKEGVTWTNEVDSSTGYLGSIWEFARGFPWVEKKLKMAAITGICIQKYRGVIMLVV